MTLKLWGRSSSGNVQKALWALDELGLPYKAIEAGGAHGIVGDAAYRAMNPNGLVPTLEEDGFVLWESNAILRYLAQHHGGPLALPEAPRARALIDQWLDWQATSFTPAMRDAFWQLYRAADPDRGLIAASVEKSEAMAEILDHHLEGRTYVVGDSFSIADIALGCAAHRWLNLPAERIERPALRRWYERVAARPGAAASGPPLSAIERASACRRLSSSTISATSSVILARRVLRFASVRSPSRMAAARAILMLTSLSEQSTPAELSMKSVLQRPPANE